MTLNIPQVQEYIDQFPHDEAAIRRVDNLFKTRFSNTVEFACRAANTTEAVVEPLLKGLVNVGSAEVKYGILCPTFRAGLRLFKTKEEAEEPIECDLCDDTHKGEPVKTFYIVVPAVPADTRSRATVLSDRLNQFISELQAKVDEPIDTWGDTVGSRHDVELEAKERDRKLIIRLKEILK